MITSWSQPVVTTWSQTIADGAAPANTNGPKTGLGHGRTPLHPDVVGQDNTAVPGVQIPPPPLRPCPALLKSTALWHTYAMSRVRVSTTVDEHLLIAARGLRSGVTDAALLDEALKAFLGQQRSMEIDAAYAAYDRHPLNEPDEWGDLASFRAAAATT